MFITKVDIAKLAVSLGESNANIIKENFSSCSLNSFDTQQKFINKLREFLYSGSTTLAATNEKTMDIDPYLNETDVKQVGLKRLLVIQIDLTIDTKHVFDLK